MIRELKVYKRYNLTQVEANKLLFYKRIPLDINHKNNKEDYLYYKPIGGTDVAMIWTIEKCIIIYHGLIYLTAIDILCVENLQKELLRSNMFNPIDHILCDLNNAFAYTHQEAKNRASFIHDLLQHAHIS